jgi:hypothetical protein
VSTQVLELQGTLNLADVLRFQYFHTLRRTWPIAAFIILFVLLVVPLAVFAVVANPESGWTPVIKNALPFLLLLLLWFILLGIMPYRNARKVLASQAYLREPIAYTFTDEAISGTGPSTQWRIAWSVVKRIRETKSLFLVYQAPNLAIIVPKRFFQNHSHLDSWRQLVAAQVGSKCVETPGFVGRFC